jgi:hypothetical protein
MNWKLWGAPILLGISTMIGLIAALVGDGWWDTVSAITLGAPVVVGIYFGWRRA